MYSTIFVLDQKNGRSKHACSGVCMPTMVRRRSISSGWPAFTLLKRLSSGNPASAAFTMFWKSQSSSSLVRPPDKAKRIVLAAMLISARNSAADVTSPSTSFAREKSEKTSLLPSSRIVAGLIFPCAICMLWS